MVYKSTVLPAIFVCWKSNKTLEIITPLRRAEVADPLSCGSIDRSLSTSVKAEGGKFLNVSAIRRIRPQRVIIMHANELTSVLPGMICLPVNNSARMQPALHISIAGPYSVAPSKSSGALYQRVTTRLVNGRF
ncbi:hypothetical protein SADUNF_Sadunf19G0077900 [Salix dunnii]|uniref:Uncharacterized protein n=1 Tax=Salix dunnii TaxID=1413687 RepID=A0A835J629_9ROSI|nr:hypothetical protein SADUNF_Sadunf19G0077900 [Salix dunnii]